jgi:hypothetical protein
VATAEAIESAAGAEVSGWAVARLGSRPPFAAASAILVTAGAAGLAWHGRRGSG